MSWKSCAKIEIPHPENHILKVFRFRSWKPRVWKSRPQSWDPKSWKPCPENHILKFPRSFWVLETRSANSRSPKLEDPTSWKFPGLGVGNPHRVCPKTEISCLENHVLKNFMSRFWWTPQCKQTPGGQKLRQLRTPQGTGSDWKNLPGTAHTDTVALINKMATLLQGALKPVASRHECDNTLHKNTVFCHFYLTSFTRRPLVFKRDQKFLWNASCYFETPQIQVFTCPLLVRSVLC